jgi:hypothetical protein
LGGGGAEWIQVLGTVRIPSVFGQNALQVDNETEFALAIKLYLLMGEPEISTKATCDKKQEESRSSKAWSEDAKQARILILGMSRERSQRIKNRETESLLRTWKHEKGNPRRREKWNPGSRRREILEEGRNEILEAGEKNLWKLEKEYPGSRKTETLESRAAMEGKPWTQ